MAERAAGVPARHHLLYRVKGGERRAVAFFLDGIRCEGVVGDTLLTAVLTQAAQLRISEFGDGPRAGFCLMGACQDCWMLLEDGSRLRACTTPLRAGMRVLTAPGAAPAEERS